MVFAIAAAANVLSAADTRYPPIGYMSGANTTIPAISMKAKMPTRKSTPSFDGFGGTGTGGVAGCMLSGGARLDAHALGRDSRGEHGGALRLDHSRNPLLGAAVH